MERKVQAKKNRKEKAERMSTCDILMRKRRNKEIPGDKMESTSGANAAFRRRKNK